MRRILLTLAIAIALVTGVVFAAGTYRADISVTDTSAATRSGLPVHLTMGVSGMADQGFLSSSGLDSRVFEGTSELDYMLAEDRLGVLLPSLSASQEKIIRLETGYSPANTSFGLVSGTGGYVTIADAAALELGDVFMVEVDGWVDTASGSGKNLVYKADAFRTYISAAGSITSEATKAGPTVFATVTATGVSSGDHVVKTTCDGTDLKIYIDGVEEDSAATSGDSVNNASGDWELSEEDSVPYIDYYKHTVGATLVVHYEPIAIIVNTGEEGTADSGTTITLVDSILTQGDDYWNLARLVITDTTDDLAPEGETAVVTDFTAGDDTLHFAALTAVVGTGDTYTVDFGTLSDREGASQNGTITWGVNSNLGTEVGGLSSIVSYTSTPVDAGEPPVVIEAPGEIPGFFGETDTIEDMPWYDLFLPAALGLEWSPNLLYSVMGLFAGVGLGVGVAIATGSSLLAIVGVGLGLAVAAGTGVLGWWVVLVYGLVVGTFLVVSRSM